MNAITKERIKLFIKNPLDNGLTRGEQMELARIALASLEAEAVMFCISGQNVDSEEHVSTSKAVVDAWVEEWNQVDGSPGEPLYKTMPLYYHAALPAPVVPDEMYWQDAPVEGSSKAAAYATGWNACRTAMLQSGNFRESKNSSTNNFREIAETSTNYPVIPDGLSTVCAEAYQVVGVMADALGVFGDAAVQKVLDNLSQQKLVHRDVLPFSLPVTPDGWISCSDRMPNDAQWCVVNTEYGYYVQCWSEGQGWLGDDISIPKCDVINWMPLPEPPQG
ncbi:TPA: DUF551 domain-containing protein [Escherichia coli]|nr:DUF551 domain-containing protein [Escherichia coli]